MPTFDDVRRLSLGLPETNEVLTWGTDATFRVGSRIFAISSEGADHVSIKASLAGQAELLDLDPVTFGRAAYVGRFGWVTVDLGRVDGDVLARLLLDAWRLTAPKGMVARMAAAKPSDTPETKAR
ncbi:MAG TPA: MmcQ/YjbR family DNA-binding protein [Candidatus Acidoferrum sp.]|nr:MmcQ/YjbR family DNA-binding protein [Candidatus Acidoferrum sp.]